MDESPVMWNPPRSIQSQMSLTPKPLPHPEPTRRARGEMIEPIMGGNVGAVRPHLLTLAEDLGERLVDDFEEYERWPTKLCLTATHTAHFKEGTSISSRTNIEHVSALRRQRGSDELEPSVVQASLFHAATTTAGAVMASISTNRPLVKLNLKVECFERATGRERHLTDFFPSPARQPTKARHNKEEQLQPEVVAESAAPVVTEPPLSVHEPLVAPLPVCTSAALDLATLMRQQVSKKITGEQVWEILNQRHVVIHGFRIDAAHQGQDPQPAEEVLIAVHEDVHAKGPVVERPSCARTQPAAPARSRWAWDQSNSESEGDSQPLLDPRLLKRARSEG